MADAKDLKVVDSVAELAARAEAVGLLERSRNLLRGTGPRWGSRAVGLLADLDTFLGPSEGSGGAAMAEEKPAGEGGDGEVFTYDPPAGGAVHPVGSHAADLQALRVSEGIIEDAILEVETLGCDRGRLLEVLRRG